MPKSRTQERIIQLFPSVPHDVKMISPEVTLNCFAMVFRAVSINALVWRPMEYVEEGFPKSLVKILIISFTTSGRTDVVAALSKYIWLIYLKIS